MRVPVFTGMLIGNLIEIVDSKDPTLLGRSGLVLGETKQTILLQEVVRGVSLNSHEERRLTIPKKAVTIRLLSNSSPQTTILRGNEILGAPQERIKG